MRNKWLLRIAGFFVFVIVACAIEAAIISAMMEAGYRPRGLLWLAAPIIAGLFGAKWLERDMPKSVAKASDSIQSSLAKRIFIAGSFSWVIGTGAFIFIFDPLGSYWSSDEWETFWKVILVPPIVLAICLFVFFKLGFLGGGDRPKRKMDIGIPMATKPIHGDEHADAETVAEPLPPASDIRDFDERLRAARGRLSVK